MSELKPCPFCGSTDLYVVQAQNEEYHSVEPEISCKKCRYTIKLKELAIAIDESPETNADWWDKGTAKKWNNRPAEDAKDREIWRLKAEVTRYRRALHNLKEDCQKRFHWKDSSLEGLFLHEVITHIDAELDYAPDSTKGVEK